jgi:hypothetical protein
MAQQIVASYKIITGFSFRINVFIFIDWLGEFSNNWCNFWSYAYLLIWWTFPRAQISENIKMAEKKNGWQVSVTKANRWGARRGNFNILFLFLVFLLYHGTISENQSTSAISSWPDIAEIPITQRKGQMPSGIRSTKRGCNMRTSKEATHQEYYGLVPELSFW